MYKVAAIFRGLKTTYLFTAHFNRHGNDTSITLHCRCQSKTNSYTNDAIIMNSHINDTYIQYVRTSSIATTASVTVKYINVWKSDF